MALAQAWRWFGPNDRVTLPSIDQAGARHIVSALHHIPVGEIWPVEEIQHHKNFIENNQLQLKWTVVESVNVHEAIRQGKDSRDKYIENYACTLRNLAKAGIHTVCYNFMPLLDWTRTHLNFELANGARTLRFDKTAFAAFDLFVLKREEAFGEYTPKQIERAKVYINHHSKHELRNLTNTILQGLPGTLKVLSLSEFRDLLAQYDHFTKEQFQANLKYFLEHIIPVAEEVGVNLCCHPDDPAFPLFGIPRIVSTENDLEYLVHCVNSPNNGITYCTGSLSSNAENDLCGIIKQLGHKIHFAHLRNIIREADGSFYEAEHLGGSFDMAEIMKLLVMESENRKAVGRLDFEIPYRPDHGHQILDDQQKKMPFPGYSAIGRLKGLAELRGLEQGIRAMM